MPKTVNLGKGISQQLGYEHKVAKAEWRRQLDWIGEKLGIKTQADWYGVVTKDVCRYGGSNLLRDEYSSSLFAALRSIYPEFEWNPLLFGSVRQSPSSYWKNEKNQRKMLDYIAEELGIETHSDWYAISATDLQKVQGSKLLLGWHKDSLYSLLQSVYKEFEWDKRLVPPTEMLFRRYPNKLHPSQKREILDSISEQLNIKTQSDWYSVSYKKVRRLRGGYSLHKDNSSFYLTLKSAYPEYEWSPSLFKTEKNFKFQKSTQRSTFDELALKLGVKKKEDWYSVTGREVARVGGMSLVANVYKGSLYNALKTVYPEYDWNPLEFRFLPKRFNPKDSPQFQTVMQHSLETLQSGVEENRYRLLSRLRSFGGNLAVLDMLPRSHGFYFSEQEHYLENLLKTVSTVECQQKIAGHSIDFYFPQLSTAIEVQGSQHYVQTYRGDLRSQRVRDMRKRNDLQQLGITLIEVPYWWNGNFTSLLNTLKKSSEIKQQAS